MDKNTILNNLEMAWSLVEDCDESVEAEVKQLAKDIHGALGSLFIGHQYDVILVSLATVTAALVQMITTNMEDKEDVSLSDRH